MTLHTCSVPRCTNPAVRKKACLLCDRKLCATHLRPDHHTCPHWSTDEDAWHDASSQAENAEITSLLARINVDALKARASSLRGGIPCDIPPLAYDSGARLKSMGGMNYHVDITFDDGVVWLCRTRRQNASSSRPDLRDRILLSEATTLKFLATTSVPVPKVHDVAVESADNAVGVGYILMDKLSGSPLMWDDLNDTDKRRKVVEQMAKIFVELERHSFPAIGCLEQGDKPAASVGPLLAEDTADVDDSGKLDLLGPFKSNLDYHTAFARRQLALITRKEAYTDCAVDAYLVHRYLLDIMPSFLDRRNSRSYFLKHMDDKGDHILVDEDLNITGIIDWEWAQTTTRSEAFAAPIFLLDVGAYYDGDNELSADEDMLVSALEKLGRADLASLVRTGRVEHRLAFCLGGEVDDTASFPNLFYGLRRALKLNRCDDAKEDWDSWKAEVMERYRNDAGLTTLL